MRVTTVVSETFHSVVHTLFAVFWSEMVSRTTGPLALRFVLQPLMASAFAIWDGIGDARSKRVPYLMGVVTNPATREERVLEGLSAVSRVFLLATLMDLIYQYLALDAFRPLQALTIGFFLAFVPYVIVRGLAARIFRSLQGLRQRKNKTNPARRRQTASPAPTAGIRMHIAALLTKDRRDKCHGSENRNQAGDQPGG